MFQISKSLKKLINIHILDTSVLKFHIFLSHFISCLFTNFSRQQLLGDLIQKHLVRQVKNPRTPICLKTPLVQEDPPAYPRVPFHCHPQVIIFIFCLLSCLLLVYFLFTFCLLFVYFFQALDPNLVNRLHLQQQRLPQSLRKDPLQLVFRYDNIVSYFTYHTKGTSFKEMFNKAHTKRQNRS